VFARLMFPPGANDGYRGRFDGDYHLGLSLWTQDYPKADRFFSMAVRRLTRIHVRSVVASGETSRTATNPYYWPWLYAVAGGRVGINE